MLEFFLLNFHNIFAHYNSYENFFLESRHKNQPNSRNEQKEANFLGISKVRLSGIVNWGKSFLLKKDQKIWISLYFPSFNDVSKDHWTWMGNFIELSNLFEIMI